MDAALVSRLNIIWWNNMKFFKKKRSALSEENTPLLSIKSSNPSKKMVRVRPINAFNNHLGKLCFDVMDFILDFLPDEDWYNLCYKVSFQFYDCVQALREVDENLIGRLQPYTILQKQHEQNIRSVYGTNFAISCIGSGELKEPNLPRRAIIRLFDRPYCLDIQDIKNIQELRSQIDRILDVLQNIESRASFWKTPLGFYGRIVASGITAFLLLAGIIPVMFMHAFPPCQVEKFVYNTTDNKTYPDGIDWGVLTPTCKHLEEAYVAFLGCVLLVIAISWIKVACGEHQYEPSFAYNSVDFTNRITPSTLQKAMKGVADFQEILDVMMFDYNEDVLRQSGGLSR